VWLHKWGSSRIAEQVAMLFLLAIRDPGKIMYPLSSPAIENNSNMNSTINIDHSSVSQLNSQAVERLLRW